jgi:uncharacterized alpha-E superfamily protein
VIKPSYPYDDRQPSIESALGKYMNEDQRDALAGRMLREGNAYTVQSYMPLSQMPTWHAGRIHPKSAMLRVFAVSDGAKGWRVLPGGLMRIASGEYEIASMQSGGSSADVWVCGSAHLSAAPESAAPRQALVSVKRLVTSRSAENLFWLGRYSERTECTLQAAQHVLSHLANMHDAPLDEAMQDWLSILAVQNSLVLSTVPDLTQSPRVFERSLLAALGDIEGSYSVGFNLQALRGAAFNVRERLSQEQWELIVQSEQTFSKQSIDLLNAGEHPTQIAIALLSATGIALAAITGAQTDRMTRDDGWRLLSAGRLLERMQFLACALLAGFEQGTLAFDQNDSQTTHPAGFDAMLALFDSTTTFRSLHSNRRDMPALLEVLVMDPDHPRSLAWVAKTLRGRLAKLSGDLPQSAYPLAMMVPDTATWHLVDISACDANGQPAALLALLAQCTEAVAQVTQAIGEKYFTHSHFSANSVGS